MNIGHYSYTHVQGDRWGMSVYLMMQKIKGQHHVTYGFCPEICILQETYGTGTIEYGQIGCDEIHLTKGVVVNFKIDKMGGISKVFFDNKIMENLVGKDKIDPMEQLTSLPTQFSFQNTSGRLFNTMSFFESC